MIYYFEYISDCRNTIKRLYLLARNITQDKSSFLELTDTKTTLIISNLEYIKKLV